jgi:membrane-bound serine protease (ClpP class)
MAPTTHVGAATPVSLTGDDPGKKQDGEDEQDSAPDDDDEADESTERNDSSDDTDSATEPDAPDSAMGRKVLNDAIAYIRGLAEAHGRNADWAEDAVRNAATLTAAEALEMNVIDLIAANQAELLQAMHGREVKVNNLSVIIDSESLDIEEIEPNWRLKVLNTIASPEIAILLLMVGLYGLLFEGYNPGAILPGVAGVICLLLAAYALQVLPVNYAGLALIIVGLLLITAEAFAPSFGVLGLGGIVAIIFGSIMMFDSGIPGFGISLTFVTTLALAAGGLLFWMVHYLVRLQRRGAVSGQESILGGRGVALDTFLGEGKVWLEGEAWHARSKVQVNKDQEVVIRNMDGLVLDVEPVEVAEKNTVADSDSDS